MTAAILPLSQTWAVFGASDAAFNVVRLINVRIIIIIIIIILHLLDILCLRFNVHFPGGPGLADT